MSALVVLGVLALSACGGSDATTVNVTMADFSMKPEVPSVAAGEIKFEVRNNGTFGHEMVVVKVADASDLPTKPDGEVNEDAIPESERMGEVEAVNPGFSKTLKLKLSAGKYVLFCNSVDGTKVHFKAGMHADFTVTS
jgi:uncharacterized cupredoxin-like copper-binding protein